MRTFSARALSLFLLLAFLSPVAASAGEYSGGLSVREITKTSVTADGQPVEYLRTDSPEVTALVVEIPPGGETGWHFHPVPVYAYVISGTLEVEMENGKSHTYHEGDAIIEMVHTPHNGKNRGTTPARLAVFYTGGKGTPNTVKVKGE